jgi:hypothetical protein
MATAIGEGLLAGRLEKIPLLVDVDAHVVESPDLWSSRLPARYRDVGPRLVHAPAGEVALVDGKYVERPGTEGPDVAWWLYEETATQLNYFRQVYSCSFKDSVGVELLDKVGEDNVLFETDYPHQDGTWPRSRQAAAQQFGHLDQAKIDKIARGNAIRLLALDHAC